MYRSSIGITALLALASPSAALADGTFNTSSIFAPKDVQRLVVGTTFGLVLSDDDGMTWKWVCQEAIASLSVLRYQVGPSSSPAYFAVAPPFAKRSTDGGCAWESARVPGDDVLMADVFPDPSDPARVLMIGRSRSATGADALYESKDGGHTFPRKLFTVAPHTHLGSVETARTSSKTIYLTASTASSPQQVLVFTSTDAGRSFRSMNHTETTGRRPLGIAAIDPTDPMRVYFRVYSQDTSEGDRLAITDDGGRTLRVPLTLMGSMTAFLRMENGALIVGAGTTSFTAPDAGAPFVSWGSGGPPIAGLAERDGAIYVAVDQTSNTTGYGAAVTKDFGKTFTQLLAFPDIDQFIDCPSAKATCADPLCTLRHAHGETCARDVTVGGKLPERKLCGCTAAAPSGGGDPPISGVTAILLFAALRVRRQCCACSWR